MCSGAVSEIPRSFGNYISRLGCMLRLKLMDLDEVDQEARPRAVEGVKDEADGDG